MEHTKTLIITTGIVLSLLLMTISWINTPTWFSTSHYIDVEMDNQTMQSINRIAEAQEYSCETELLNYSNRLIIEYYSKGYLNREDFNLN